MSEEHGTPKPAPEVARLERQWVGKRVRCDVRGMGSGVRYRDQIGTVRGISTNQAEAEDMGYREWGATGLLVEIPDLGRTSVYGEWPVFFGDARVVSEGDES